MLAARVQVSGVQCATCFASSGSQLSQFSALDFLFFVWFFFVLFGFSKHKLMEISVHMAATGADSAWTAMMLNSWSDFSSFLFGYLIFLKSHYNMDIKINFVASLTFHFFTILAFKNIIYISKRKIGFALIFWEILSTLVLSSFSSEQIKIYLLFSLKI